MMLPMRCDLNLNTIAGVLSLFLAAGTFASAQDALEIPGSPSDLWREPVLPRNVLSSGMSSGGEANTTARLGSIHLFRMPTALPTDPIGMETDDDPVLGGDSAAAPSDAEGSSNSHLIVALGSDNPFLDYRHASDPGGVGYYRLYSQYMFLDQPVYGASLGLQAWTPAGLEAYGLADGPTTVCPNFSWFYDLGTGTAIHGFISKDFRPRPGWTDGVADRSMHYGLALQSPCPGPGGAPLSGVHLFVEALGAHRSDNDATFQLLPGVHWQIRDNWWFAGGFILPTSSNRPDGSRLWQLTCSWQF
jgi:hypothetical protein